MCYTGLRQQITNRAGYRARGKRERTMQYIGVALREEIRVEKLFTVHYFEYSKSYSFPGESHDFWECVYVDRGEILVTAGEERQGLSRGEILFHQPNEWHALQANGVVAPNLVVLSFSSSSPAMERFVRGRWRVGQQGRALMGKIIRLSEQVFSTPLGDPGTHEMHRRPDVPASCEQQLRMALEELLLLLLETDATRPATPLRRRSDKDLFGRLDDYMREHIGARLTLADLAACAGVSESTVKNLFRLRTGGGALAYFNRMKIDAARAYIREGNYTMSEIADLLGYESIHYFSRQFRAVTGASPREYSRSVRAIEEKTEE